MTELITILLLYLSIFFEKYLKNAFQYGLYMEFSNQEQYQQYNLHPAHVAFINEQWIPCVADFLEIDYEPLAEEFF